jgi:hypothetical protein
VVLTAVNVDGYGSRIPTRLLLMGCSKTLKHKARYRCKGHGARVHGKMETEKSLNRES